ncbi:hypothetical protein Tco_0001782 [Tanacetum coccineum]
MGTIDSMKSGLTQSALDALCEKYYIPDVVHPQLHGRNDRIQNSLAGISRYYTLDEGCYPAYWDDEDKEMDLFAFIHHADPTKVMIGEREVREGEVLLLELTQGRVVLLVGVNDKGGVAAQGVGDDNVNEGSDDTAVADHTGRSGPVVQIGGIDIEVNAETQALRLREDHGTFGDAGVSTAGKSLVALQDFLNKSTLAAEIGVTAAATVPFVTSYVTPIPEHEGSGHIDSVSTANLRTKCPAERFIISSDIPHDSSVNAADDEVSSIVRSIVPDPVVLTMTIATTVMTVTSVPFPKEGDEPAHASIFADSTFVGTVGTDVTGPSQTADADPTTDSSILVDQLAPPVLFSQLRAIEYDHLFTEFNVGAARQTCLGAEVRMRLEHVLRGKKRLEGKCSMQANLLKERDAEIVDLKSRLSLREVEAAEAIRLRCQIANVEAVEAARASELESLKERNVALKGRFTALESVAVAKDSEVAKLTRELSSLQLSCDDLSIKASTLECKKDKLVDQAFALAATCSELHDEVSGYKLFREHIEVVQDTQVKVLSDRVTDLDAEVMRMALYLDEEFYPRYLTTIAGRRWILSHGLRIVVMKCLQSPDYLAALGGVIGRAIDKGIQDGLADDIDHGKAGRVLVEVAAYNPAAKANYVSAMNALRDVDFPFLTQLASRKDSSIFDLMDLLRLEGPMAETPEAEQLQPSLDQLMLPIHRLEDQVVIGETSLSFSLDLVGARMRKLKENAASQRLSISDALVPIVEPLSAENLVGEANTSGVPAAVATTTALSTTFVESSFVPPMPHAEAPPSTIVFKKEELDTTLEHTTAP